MEISNLAFDFDFEDFTGKGSKRPRIEGITMTVYRNHCGITEELRNALGNPERVRVGISKKMNAIYIAGDPNGLFVSTGRSRNQFSSREIREGLKKYFPYDDTKQFCRLTNGKKFGEYIFFSLDDIVLLATHERGKKDGK